MSKLEYYVYHYDSNENKIEPFNIFRSARFQQNLEHIKKKKEFNKETVRTALMNAFWCKFEYEIDITGHDLNRCKPTRVDVFDQVWLNIDVFMKYLKDNYFKGV